MINSRLVTLIIALVVTSFSINAHPVIWKQGTATMIQDDDMATHTMIHYSLDYDWSLGLHQINFKESNERYTMGQSNWLLKRWNGLSSQGNIYLLTGLGFENSSSESMVHAGLQADWETRRYYTLIKGAYYGTEEPIIALQGRLGIAPYIASFESAHLWLILHLEDVIIDNEHASSVMPVIRLFKDNILLEYGNDFDDKYFVAAMYHF